MVRDAGGWGWAGGPVGWGGAGAGRGAESVLSLKAQLGVGAPKAFLSRAGESKCDVGALPPTFLSFLIFFFSFSSFPSLSYFFPFSSLSFPIFFLCSFFLFPSFSAS